jgi:hypothetical protein
MMCLSKQLLALPLSIIQSYNPTNAETKMVWAVPVRSPLLRESLLFSIPPVT